MENILKRLNFIPVGIKPLFLTKAAERESAETKAERFHIIEKLESITQKLCREREYFDSVTDDDLTESSIHRTIALECEYRYWIRRAKQENAVFSPELHTFGISSKSAPL